MTVRAVEGKLPYTGGKAITVDENKVISLNLRDENNLIIYDQGDNEIYVDLQLPAGIRPNYAFPVGITTGRVLVADDWDVTGTIIVAKTTSGDVIKLLYGDDGTLWMDNGTGLFKQIYFKADVDLIITNLTNYINTELAKKQNGVSSVTAPSNPQPGDLWYNTSTNEIKVWKGTNWEELGGGSGDVQVSTDTGNLLSTGVKLWLGDKLDFDDLGSLDANTIYAPIEGIVHGRLPAEYQEVERIESSGTQYIDTGKTVSGDVKIDYKYVPKENVNSNIDAGELVNMSDGWRVNGFGSGNTYLYYGGYTNNNDGSGVTVDALQQNVECHDIISKSGSTRNNSATWVPSSAYPTPSGTLKLFVFQESGVIKTYFKTRMLTFQRYDSGVLTQDLVPCYRIADNIIGLYDLVEGVFYTNAGTGTFTKGNNVG